MDSKEDKICVKLVKNMIKERHYTFDYIEGYIIALLDCNAINDNEFEELNKMLNER